MTIHLPKVNQFGGGNGGGGGSSSFPTIVTSSGSSLPATTGFSDGDTFLNTSDKKIYTIFSGYALASDVTNNGDLDYSTGKITGFTTSKFLSVSSSRYSSTVNDIDIHFKTGADVSTKQYVLSSYSIRNYQLYVNCRIYIENGKLYFKDEEVCAVQANTDYNIKGRTYTSMQNEYFLAQVEEDGVAITNARSYAISFAGTIVVGGEATSNTSVTTNPFLGTIYGDTNYAGTICEIASNSWDNGTSLTDKTEYADKTNGILYLYEDDTLTEIGGGGGTLTKKVYTISSTTTTLDVSADFTTIVDVLKNGVEIYETDDYTVSNGVITFVTALSTTDKICVKGE